MLILNQTIFTKYRFARRISNLPVGQYLVNITGLAGIENKTVYKTEPIITGLGHGKLFEFLTSSFDYAAIFEAMKLS